MRTTLTLDQDVMERLRREAEMGKRPFKEIVNEALRRGLGLPGSSVKKSYRVTPHSSEFVSGIDTTRLNRLADEIEAIELLGKIRR